MPQQPGYFEGVPPGQNPNIGNGRMMQGGEHPPFFNQHQNANEQFNYPMQGGQFARQPLHPEQRFDGPNFEMGQRPEHNFAAGPPNVSNPHLQLRNPAELPRSHPGGIRSKSLCYQHLVSGASKIKKFMGRLKNEVLPPRHPSAVIGES